MWGCRGLSFSYCPTLHIIVVAYSLPDVNPVDLNSPLWELNDIYYFLQYVVKLIDFVTIWYADIGDTYLKAYFHGQVINLMLYQEVLCSIYISPPYNDHPRPPYLAIKYQINLYGSRKHISVSGSKSIPLIFGWGGGVAGSQGLISAIWWSNGWIILVCHTSLLII